MSVHGCTDPLAIDRCSRARCRLPAGHHTAPMVSTASAVPRWGKRATRAA